MNLASRCREAISHVAMLKKELAQQQKRTADALASQREQTQRMADSLTSSMELSRVSGRSSAASPSNSLGGETMEEKDVDMSRLISSTPSPVRTMSSSSIASPLSAGSTPTTNSGNEPPLKRSSSPSEEARESPPPDSPPSVSPKGGFLSSMDEDDTVEDTLGSPLAVKDDEDEDAEEPTKEAHVTKTKATEEHDNNSHQKPPRDKSPMVYSTPKRSERLWAPKFNLPGIDGSSDQNIFPFSASPKTVMPSGHKQQSYNEEFPSDIIDQPSHSGSYDSSIHSQQPKLSLVNSIDAFEKSFNTNFPDSFTPKESSSSGTKETSATEIYNPFIATPERRVGKMSPSVDSNEAESPIGRRKTGEDPYTYRTPEEKKCDEPEASYRDDAVNCTVETYETPPRDEKTIGGAVFCSSSGDPGRPEKTMSSAARARYERALQPRKKDDNQAPSPPQKAGSSSALLRRIQKKRVDNQHQHVRGESEPEISSNVAPSLSQIEAEVSPRRSMSESIIDIVDTYEDPPGEADQQRKQNVNFPITSIAASPRVVNGVQSIASRLGNIKSLRRNVKKPVSYAEPALNTKLRRGDTFFPKTAPQASQSPNKSGLVTPDGSPAKTAVVQ